MKRNNLWVLWNVVLSMLLAMSPAGCKKSSEPGSENSNESSLQTGSESPPDDPRRELPELSDHAKDFAEKRERVRQGETVDFWGDGSKYRAWFDEEGVRHVEIRNAEDQIRSTFKTWPDGSEISTYSAHADGIIDRQIEKTPGKEIQLYDRNRAGFFNEELTLITLESGMIHRILRKRTSATGQWEVIKDSVIPPAHGVPPPGLLENFERFKKKRAHEPLTPSKAVKSEQTSGDIELPQEWHVGYETYVQFTWDGESVNGQTQCSYDDMMKMQSAFDSVMGEGVRDCLSQASVDAADLLKKTMESGQKILVGCNLGDFPELSQYDAYTILGERVIAFNRDRLQLANSNRLKELMLHELLHVSGFPFNPDTHDNGTDELYSCARYCTASASAKAATNHSVQADCERCGLNAKAKCKIDCDKLAYMLPGFVSRYEGRGDECDILMSCAGFFDYIFLGKGVEATLRQGAPSLRISQGKEHAHCVVTHSHVEGAPVHALTLGGQGGVRANASTESLVYIQLQEDAKLSLEYNGGELVVDAFTKAELKGEVHLASLLALRLYSSTTLLQGSANGLALAASGGFHDLGGLRAEAAEVIAVEGAHAIVHGNQRMSVTVASGGSVDYNKPEKCTYTDADAGVGGDCP